MSNACPCKGCVPPKRTPDCHSICPDYKKWDAERKETLAKIREINHAEDDCFPVRLRKRKKGRR